MSKVIDAPAKLGEYMLKGWVLTDTPCPTPSCPVPLLRSPKGTTPVVHYCANCEIDPHSTLTSPGPARPVSGTPTSPAASSSAHSRPSTPPTEFSSGLSSPTFAPPLETPESVRRREQIEEASAEIGRRMLRGYAMLADECPNPRCYGVPLVRPPKPGPEKDPRKECVVCGRTYIKESDLSQWDQIQPTREVAGGPDRQAQRLGKPNPNDSTVRPSKGKQPEALAPEISTATHQSLLGPGQMANDPRQLPSSALADNLQGNASQCLAVDHQEDVLQSSIDALYHALAALRQRLVSETNDIRMDPAVITVIADSMSRTAQAITNVKAAQRS